SFLLGLTPSSPLPQRSGGTAPNATNHAPPAFAASTQTTPARARCAFPPASCLRETPASQPTNCTRATCGTLPREPRAGDHGAPGRSPTGSGPFPESSDSLRTESAAAGSHKSIRCPSSAPTLHSASTSLETDACAAPQLNACVQFRPSSPPTPPLRPAAAAHPPARTISRDTPVHQQSVLLPVVSPFSPPISARIFL